MQIDSEELDCGALWVATWQMRRHVINVFIILVDAKLKQIYIVFCEIV